MHANSFVSRLLVVFTAVMAAFLLGFTARHIGFTPNAAAPVSTTPMLGPVLNPPISHVLNRR